MNFDNLDQFANVPPGQFGKGPAALVIAEDRVEVASSVDSRAVAGVQATSSCLAPPEIEIPPFAEGTKAELHIIRGRSRAPGATQAAMNILIDKMPGAWLHYCYNGEYLFFPFCEDRSVGENGHMGDGGTAQRDPDLCHRPVRAGSARPTQTRYRSTPPFSTVRATTPEGRPRRERQPARKATELLRRPALAVPKKHVAKPKRKIDRIRASSRRNRGCACAKDPHAERRGDEHLCLPVAPFADGGDLFVPSGQGAAAPIRDRDTTSPISAGTSRRKFHWSSMQLMELGLMEPGQWF